MHKLIEKVYGNSLRLDAGFNDRELVRKIAERSMTPYVFPKSNNNLNGSLAWKNMYLELFFDVMHWLTEYHLRSHSESFHSSFKGVYGMITKNKISQRKRWFRIIMTKARARCIRCMRLGDKLILRNGSIIFSRRAFSGRISSAPTDLQIISARRSVKIKYFSCKI